MSALKKVAAWVTIIVAILGIFWLISPPASESASTSDGKPVAGMMAPDFSLPSTDGSTATLSSYKGKQNVLIYFSEGLTCDPCMQQIPILDQYSSAFTTLKVAVLNVTMDSVEASKESMNRYGIKSPILSYNDAHTEKNYDLTPYSMGMGRRAGHTFILVDTTGKILWRKDYWPGVGMSVQGGTMSVSGQEIVSQVTKALGAQT
jgi:peroxiredoxin